MKQVHFNTIICLFAAAFFAITSCGKTGPKGDTGPLGPAGVTGSTGPQGTANVIYSEWINATWPKVGEDGSCADSIPAPKVTADVMDKGIVLVYFRADAQGTLIKLLPTPIYDSTNHSSFTIDFAIFPGFIVPFSGAPVQGTTGAAQAFPDAQFRYIILPGGTPNARVSSDYYSYENVCARYHIPK